MADILSFLGKIIAASAAIAILIKYGAPYLSIPATPATALTFVLLPTVGMVAVMVWRSQSSTKNKAAD